MISTPLQPVLARASALLDRGRGSAAAELLEPLLQARSLKRVDEFVIRGALAEAWLLRGDPGQASTVLGRPPDQIRDTLPQALLATLWRLHGKVAAARGEQSRAIALHARALKHAEAAHDSRGIGLAHLELVNCYRKVGDHTIVREHSPRRPRRYAAGDRRHLAEVHSASGVLFAQQGRYDDAAAALRNAERLASALGADDVLALAYVNQAGVAQLRRRYDQAVALAERAVALHESVDQPHRLAASLATLGQINVKLGHLDAAEWRCDVPWRCRTARRCCVHEINGAIYDTLAQIALMRGDYEGAAEHLKGAAAAFGRHATARPVAGTNGRCG
ncbi:MAG: tetratricopeptide repeat protein [Candidatus Binatia bacterium]